MKVRILRGLIHGLLVLVVLLSLLLLLLRFLWTHLDVAKGPVEAFLGDQMGANVQIGRLEGRFDGWRPGLEVRDIHVGDPVTGPQVDVFQVSLDMVSWLLDGVPTMDYLRLSGARMGLVQTDEAWLIEGVGPVSSLAGGSSVTFEDIHRLLRGQRQLELSALELRLKTSQSAFVPMYLDRVLLVNTDMEAKGEALLSVAGEPAVDLRFLTRYAGGVSGLRNPWPLSGQGTLTLDLDGMRDRLQGLRLGTMTLDNIAPVGRFAMNWSKGETPVIGGSLAISDLGAGMDGRLDRLGLKAGLEVRFPAQAEMEINLYEPTIEANDQVLKLGTFQARHQSGTDFSGWTMRVADFPLLGAGPFFGQLNLLPEDLRNYLGAIHPEGNLTGFRFRLPDEGPDWQLSVQLSEGRTLAWDDHPALEGVSAYVEAGPRDGFADLNVQGGFVHLTGLYDEGWPVEWARGRVHWRLLSDNDVRVWGHQMAAALPGIEVTGGFSLRLSDTMEDSLVLSLYSEVASTSAIRALVPDAPGILPDTLDVLLNEGFTAGTLHDTGFLMRLPLGYSPVPDASLVVQLLTRVEDLSVRFHPDWPEATGLSGRYSLLDEGSFVRAEKGMLRSSQLEDVDVDLFMKSYGQQPLPEDILYISGRVSGDMGDDFAWLALESPIESALPGFVDKVRFAGPYEVAMGLDFDLASGAVDFHLDTQLEGVRADLSEMGLVIDDLRGAMVLSSKVGYQTEGLKGRLNDEPVEMAFRTDVREEGMDVHLGAWAMLDVEKTAAALGRTMAPLAYGKTPIHLSLDLATDQRSPLLVRIDSGLEGLGIRLPAPFGKHPDSKKSLSMTIRADEQLKDIRAHFGDEVGLAMALDQNNALDRMRIHLGKPDAQMPTVSAVQLFGELPEVSLDAWMAAFRSWQASRPETSRTDDSGLLPAVRWPVPFDVDLHIDEVSLFPVDFGPTRIRGDGLQSDLMLEIHNQVLNGSIGVLDEQVIADMRWLRLPKTRVLANTTPVREKPEDFLEGIDPMRLPVLHFRTQEMSLGETEFGALGFHGKPEGDGYAFHDLRWEVPGSVFKSDLRWFRKDGEVTSTLKGVMRSWDSVKTLESFGLEPQLVTEDGKITMDIGWDGSPAALRSRNIKGRISADIDELSVSTTDPGASLLKILGILNVEALLGGISGVLGDVFGDGINFDSLAGDFSINDGILKTLGEGVRLEGTTIDLRAEGEIDYIHGALDVSVGVSLPVAGAGLSYMLILGDPLIGAGIWGINRVTGDYLSRLFSASFHLGGTPGEPEVELEDLFSEL
jgi:uncharacterized protein YhdP